MAGDVLLVDDDAALCSMVEGALRRRGYRVVTQLGGQAGLDVLQTREFDVVVTDLQMRGMSGIEFCTRVVAMRPDMPVLVITAFGSLETAVQALRAGAHDFVTKPFDVEMLVLSIRNAVDLRMLRGEVKRLRERVDREQRAVRLIGDSAPMQRLQEVIARVGPTDVGVLIFGETGTGKELVARALHDASRRSSGPFVAVNCAAIPQALLESELFGHVRGAFTDAKGERRGLFQQAHGGTLLLDEVGELDPTIQPKLLRAIQERRVRPVGSDAEVEVDTRVIAATHRDLDAEVEAGRFRQDLLYRLDVVRIDVPALRARGNDVLQLAQAFVGQQAARSDKRVTGITAAAAKLLLAYPWPGNVRELGNAIERAVALTEYEAITPADLPDKVQGHRPSHVIVAAEDPADFVTLAEVERRYVLRVLDSVGGNRTRAAQILGVDRKTLYRKLQEYQEP